MPRTKLREAREAADLTQEELATRIGAEKKAVSAWETGAQRPQPGHRRAIRDTLNNDDPDLFKNFESDPEESNEEGPTPSQPCHVAAVGEIVAPTDPHENERPAFLQPCHEKDAHDTVNSSDSHHSDIQEPALLQPYHTKAKCDILTFVPPSSLQSFFVTSPINHLLCIAHTDYSTPNEMTHALQIAIQDFDAMNLDPITRREAMMTLAALPMTALGQKQPLRVRHYEETLRQCTAALEACWKLYRSSDAIGTQHAFACVCTYVPLLEMIAHDKASLRKQALDLATRYALLKTLLGWNYMNTADAVAYAQDAMTLSKATGDIQLQISAYTKLSWSLLSAQQCRCALDIMQEGEHMLKEYQRKKHGPSLPSGMIGNFYSSYSIAQVENGIDPDTAIGIATDSEPLKGHVAFVEFTASNQCIEAARIYSANGNYKQAMNWIEKRIDPETFAPRIPQSERGRIQTVSLITRSYLQSPDRDMGEIIRTWRVSMEGAQALRSEEVYRKAMENFITMRNLWSTERAIRKLLPLTSHWSK